MNAIRHRSNAIRKSCLALLIGLSLASAAQAQNTSRTASYQIPAGDLTQTVNEISRKSGIQIVYDASLLRGKRAASVSGDLNARAALDAALAGLSLRYEVVNESTIVIKPAASNPAPSRPRISQPRASASNTPDAEVPIRNMDEIIVVGSRLGGADALPIQIINQQAIERSGATSIAQVLSQLSEVSLSNNGDTTVGPGGAGAQGGAWSNSTTVQLRGLPQGTTLVLINGRRTGTTAALADSAQFDLSSIPLSMVERIEVLPSGAAAIYGGDSLAGVVNIVLKKNANGKEIAYRVGIASGYTEEQLDTTFAKNWDGGSLLIGLSYSKNSALLTSERDIISTQNFTRYGGYDFRSSASPRANVYSLAGCEPGGCFIPLNERAPLPGLTSPYATTPANQSGSAITTDSFLGTQGVLTYRDTDVAIYSPGEKYSANIAASIDLTERTELFGELTFSKSSLTQSGQDAALQAGEYGYSVLPATNPYNPFGVDVGLDYSFPGGERTYNRQYSRLLVGARGGSDRWQWEATAWQSRDKSNLEGLWLSLGLYQASMEAWLAALSSTDPATAFNPFRSDGFGGTDALRDAIFPNGTIDFTAKLTGVSANFRGDLFTLPTGNVTGLIGGEYTDESLDFGPGYFSTVGEDETKAAFGEVRVPVMGPGTLSKERLILSGALRLDQSGRLSESGTSSMLGLEFRPSESWLMRAVYTTAFKPLTIFNASQAIGTPYPSPTYDPVLDLVYDIPTFYGGGIPDGFKPEEGETTSVGFVFAPVGAYEARFSANIWDNQITNRITSLDPIQIISLYPNRATRDPVTNRVTLLDARPLNVLNTRVSGVDLSGQLKVETAIGVIRPSFSATYTYRYDEQYAVGEPGFDRVSNYSATGWAPRWKATGRATWEVGETSDVTLSIRYVGAYKDAVALASGPNAGSVQELGKLWFLDLVGQLDVSRWISPTSPSLKSTRVSFGISNLLNERPQFCMACYSAGYDATQSDIRGRYAFVQVRVGL